MPVVEFLVSAFLPVLLERLTSPELLRFLRQEGLYTRIKRWEKMWLMIQASVRYRPPSSSHRIELSVYKRDEDKRKILEKVLNDVNFLVCVWKVNRADIAEIVVAYFSDIFYSLRPSVEDIGSVTGAVGQQLPSALRCALEQPYSAAEIYGALLEMAPSKAPGIDGFNAGFYHKNWSIVGKSVTDQTTEAVDKIIIDL
ncbi:hypothetical protein JRO89_XS15G0186700 [Xanthoceras sorbifolium]|uniref:Uncharacterized protein n=1 Tax=Xanthoceras sorbifolium TaxID=99658 RepID=A0ABQ8H2Z0_9ROSI|nr:hypothetical protein JRO89_XS15G0186700 [Xanthoceras sorbifolium]